MQVLRGPSPIEHVIGSIRRKSLRWGKTQIDEFLGKYNKTAHISIICEDLPDQSNFVDLDPTQTDSDGIPAPRINYKLSENSKKMLAHGIRRAEEVMTSAGAAKTFSFGPVRATGWHLMGTARMGSDPQNSVVNEWGQSHDISNLFIADSSIFVTSGGVNPAATIQALALKVSDGVIEHLRGNMPQVRAAR
jgi:choline dehydrogenase-like flavoprotein